MAGALRQDELDRQRRAYATNIEAELRAFCARLIDLHGTAETARIRDGIADLLGDVILPRPNPNACPALFFMPDLPVEPVMGAEGRARLAPLIDALETGWPAFLSETVGKPSVSYIAGQYMRTKFDGITANSWQSVVLFDHGKWQVNVPNLQTVMAPHLDHVSGEIMLSVLEPHKEIPRHVDDNNYKLTLHLPLLVPTGDCALWVAGQTLPYVTGKCIVFADSFVHAVWNRTDGPRKILLIDIWSPYLTQLEIHALKEMRRILKPLSTPAVFAAGDS